MFYRYEAKVKDNYSRWAGKKTDWEWQGIFSFFNPTERRYFNRFLREPRWYENNPDVDSRCWFTEEGYQKYHHIMELIISGNVGYRPMDHLEIRILTKETLDNIACKGKMQYIELV